MTPKTPIRSLHLGQLQEALSALQEPAFRAKQIYEWIWKHSAVSFEEMKNLPLVLRQKLNDSYEFRAIAIDQQQKSQDGTIKFGFRLFDGHLIEGVLIPAQDRMTACVSSQVGCSLTCKFCATGYMDRKRNLEPYEIYDQVVLIHQAALQHYGMPLTNIVFMGMGEPLLNYNNVLASIERITAPDGLNMSSKRITVSTAGIAKMIRKLADDNTKFKLALSLHAANDQKRNQIMPINESNSLVALRDALKYYFQRTKSFVTYEYIVFHNFNDTLQDAEELYRFTKHIPCKVNIIEYNPIAEAHYSNTTQDRLQVFADYLEERGVTVNIRRSRGKDVDAACGQLAIKEK